MNFHQRIVKNLDFHKNNSANLKDFWRIMWHLTGVMAECFYFFAITGMSYILKYIHTENCYFKYE